MMPLHAMQGAIMAKAKKKTKQAMRNELRKIIAEKMAPKASKAEQPSRKQQVRALYRAKGEAAARALGRKMGLPDKTLDFYIKETIRIDAGEISASRAKGAVAPIKQGAVSKRDEPYYRFPSQHAAATEAVQIAQRNHLIMAALIPQQQPGGPLWALVPDPAAIKKHGAFNKTGIANLKREGFEIEAGVIKQVRKRKAA